LQPDNNHGRRKGGLPVLAGKSGLPVLLESKKGRHMKVNTLKTARTDMKTLVKDAQDLFREATTATGEKAEELRARGLQMLDSALVKAQEVQTAALETGKELAEKTDDYVHENPWRAVAISAGVGLVLGMLISRR